MKLLVVDDQGAVGAIISRIAQQGGWEAINTTTSHGLADIIRQEKVDVLMLDYLIDTHSETRTGLAVLGELRAAGLQTPVILFSGAAHLIELDQARELGVLKILEKPLSIQELRTSLNEARKKLPDEKKAGP